LFKFRLQRVLELRELREQQTATRLAEARTVADAAREATRALEDLRTESVDRLTRTHAAGAPAGELRNVSYVLESLNRKIEEANNRVHVAEEQVRGLADEFSAAVRDRRVLDMLRHRRHDEWKSSEASADRQAMDGIALNRFMRREAPSTSGS
jgi:flagellar FliJ protein